MKTGVVVAAAALGTAAVAGAGVLIGTVLVGQHPAESASKHSSKTISSPPAQPTTPPPPSPVSTAASLTSKCVTGIYDLTTNTFYPMAEMSAGDTIPAGDTIAESYQMTLTNHSPVTADVGGFAAVFYSGGQELTSSNATFDSPSFITTNQSLTWAEDPWGTSTSGEGTAVGPFAAGQMGAIDTTATCQLVRWYNGS